MAWKAERVAHNQVPSDVMLKIEQPLLPVTHRRCDPIYTSNGKAVPNFGAFGFKLRAAVLIIAEKFATQCVKIEYISLPPIPRNSARIDSRHLFHSIGLTNCLNALPIL